SCCDDFVKDLPDGLQTVIGERGKGLSEGQIQRIAIARALCTGASVILLDEATSALDEKTESRIIENLKSAEQKTCFIITHRKSMLKYCDMVIEIDESGNATLRKPEEVI
ncbi:MAG: ATP-binding cassette domain-containing protein, partial [Acutalibacteraceae bacterium]|nr:ATP-binding cassette domain-containing protein [Acutalibacteraceae bacterium]